MHETLTGDVQHLLGLARRQHLRVVDALEASHGGWGGGDDGAGGDTHGRLPQSATERHLNAVGDNVTAGAAPVG